MLPRIAMPSAPPSSVLVSESADAAPARSGGAALMIRSDVKVITTPKAIIMMTQEATTIGSDATPAWVSSAKATATATNPTHTIGPGRHRRTSAGASIEPAIEVMAPGSDQTPASNGDNPITNW